MRDPGDRAESGGGVRQGRHHTADQHAAVVRLLRAGVETGEFRADADLDAVVDGLIGATLYLLLTGRTSDAPERAEGLVRVLLDGLRATRAPAAPPGPSQIGNSALLVPSCP
ncbi:TetR/AcrR family transcriptional regulator C-terminal ligand-binding domain-containing protein [Streptomyces sp. NPDC044780]|uniref:TetR/AcrR family transcriptional regulator C-terminal ligand-binding domain-containing protein n=1 Tax=Streptomyces sp. NPDC044780 TaxID=3157199 RepID=UPI00340EBC33